MAPMNRLRRNSSCPTTRRRRSLLAALLSALLVPSLPADEPPYKALTVVSLRSGLWHINGESVYKGTRAEGLLMNVRMVNATFEDRNPKTAPKGFDPDKNTEAFLGALRDYVDHGVRAFTLCLQGGMPGYEGALNSAYNPDGTLRPTYMKRVRRVIEACDRSGVVVILSCFYQRQDQVLRDRAALERAVEQTVLWIKSRGYRNVLLEIANEQGHPGFEHAILRDAAGCASLIQLARKTYPGLLVAASSLGNGRLPHQINSASSFLLLHFNSTPVSAIPKRIGAASKASKAIVCNEDDKTGEEAVAALTACVRGLCSWGYMNKEKNQYYPFEFRGAADDPPVYARLEELTGGK